MLRSDGGPQFKAKEFTDALNRWGVEWRPSSPHFPRSNGHAEASVKAAKSLVLKCARPATSTRRCSSKVYWNCGILRTQLDYHPHRSSSATSYVPSSLPIARRSSRAGPQQSRPETARRRSTKRLSNIMTRGLIHLSRSTLVSPFGSKIQCQVSGTELEPSSALAITETIASSSQEEQSCGGTGASSASSTHPQVHVHLPFRRPQTIKNRCHNRTLN